MIEVLFALLLWHCLADYPLQGDFLSRAKSEAAPIAGVPWYQALGAHAVIHGGGVALITGIWWLGALEALAHAWIDYSKCWGRLSFNEDQALHVGCKVLWIVILIAHGMGT